MDNLPTDVLLQILVKADSRTLQLLLPQLSEEVNRPVFWQARFQFCWSAEKLPVVEKFEQTTGENISRV